MMVQGEERRGRRWCAEGCGHRRGKRDGYLGEEAMEAAVHGSHWFKDRLERKRMQQNRA